MRDARPLAMALGAVVLVAAFVGACRQAIGIDAYFNASAEAGAGAAADAGSDAAPSACGLLYGTTACASCVATSCCTESSACATNAACAPYETCLGGCNGDPACRSRCTVDNPVGTDPATSSLSACLASKCQATCSLPCGAMAASVSPESQAPGCQDCVTKHACSQASACATSVDCQAYTQCLRSCVTPDCREACAGSGDGAAALFAALENVVYGTCSTACAYGQDWSCLGRVTWPAPAATTTTIVWEGVHDALTSVRIANAQAAICGTVGNGNLPCDSPLAQGQTDDAGYIAFQVPTALGNSTNPMGIELYGAVSAPGYMPTYGYYFFPLSQSVITWAPGLSPPLWSLSMNPFTGGPSVPGAYTDTGFVLVVVLDCQGHTASGVQVTPGDPSAGTAVLTTANGIAVFNGSAGTGVAVGNLVVSAAPVGLKQEIGHVGFYVRAGAATAALLQPQP